MEKENWFPGQVEAETENDRPGVGEETARSARQGRETGAAGSLEEGPGSSDNDEPQLAEEAWEDADAPPRQPRRKGKRLVKPEETRRANLTAEQRLLVLDVWERCGLSAGDFGPLVGVSRHTLYAWRRAFRRFGPAGLMDQPRGAPKGSKLPEVTKRSILMLKRDHPEYGCQRISDELVRGPGLGASATAVARVLKEAGYELEEVRTAVNKPVERRFERAKPGELWQTDIFTFILKRQNRRVYLIAFMDDHSRFIVGHGLHGSATAALVIAVLRSAIASWGAPKEVLTDNGPQYATWRGKSQFTRELSKLGIKHVRARPKHPQTLGKVERFWGSVNRECLQEAVFLDLEDAQRRLALYMDHHNFHRPHQGLDGLVPADRFFASAPEVLATLRARVAQNALELARHGSAREPFYLTGQVGGKRVSVHASGEHVYVSEDGKARREVSLATPATSNGGEPGADGAAESEPGPGNSPLDEALQELRTGLGATVGSEGERAEVSDE